MTGTVRDALEALRENWSLEEIVKEAIRDAEWCCEVGCGSGACESCPCCCSGYCVGGSDGIPAPGTVLNPGDDEHSQEVWQTWLGIAAVHNPAVAALRSALAATADRDAVVAGFIEQREEYVRVLRQCVDADADYHRWQGHAEARRQLAEKLAESVPSGGDGS